MASGADGLCRWRLRAAVEASLEGDRLVLRDPWPEPLELGARRWNEARLERALVPVPGGLAHPTPTPGGRPWSS